MPTLEEYKAKYQSVIDLCKSSNVRLEHVHVQDGRLYLSGVAPSEKIKNRIWDKIKAVDPIYADLTCELSIDSSIPEPTRTYTVVSGDSLWKIAQRHYGNGELYPRIIAANPGKLKDDKSVIHPGDVLVVPEQ